MRRIEDEEVRRLLAAARPVRPMTSAERARTARFVAALARSKPARALGERFRWGAVAALVALGFFGSEPSEEPPSEVVIAAEPSRPPPSHGFAWYAERESIPGPDDDAPGHGDICGARVCDFMPSCCEERWDEACDRKLLDLSRDNHYTTTSIGRCSWHDREFCPKCACPYYLKRLEDRTRGILLGYDGGSGCLRDEQRMVVELKWMCAEGYCEE